MSLLSRLMQRSSTHLTRVACVLALIGLAFMIASIVWLRPVPVILAMSLGHGTGGAALAFYVAAIIIDATLGSSRTPIDQRKDAR